jgi:hypothetical protein
MIRPRRPTPHLVSLLLAVGAGLACRNELAPPSDSCTYANQPRAIGTTFPSTDGCNTCACVEDARVLCTEKACATDAAALVKPDAGRDATNPGATDGAAAAPSDGPRPADAAAACDFSAAYDYGDIGGLRAFVERTILQPGNRYTHVRRAVVGAPPLASCAPPLPACGAADAVTAFDIEQRDLADPDVRAALAQSNPPLYGRDSRPVDGTVFEFAREDGRGFLVGQECQGNSGPGTCRAIPRGIAQLVSRLRDLDRQQLRAEECRSLRGMP